MRNHLWVGAVELEAQDDIQCFHSDITTSSTSNNGLGPMSCCNGPHYSDFSFPSYSFSCLCSFSLFCRELEKIMQSGLLHAGCPIAWSPRSQSIMKRYLSRKNGEDIEIEIDVCVHVYVCECI